MQKQQKVKVIGIGPKGESFNIDYIKQADLIVGGRRLLKFFDNIEAEKIVLDKNIREKLESLKNLDKKIVILASGDPLFFGIGKLLIEIFGSQNLEFFPYLNSVQLLCSKAKVNYEDFITISIHGREISNNLIGRIKYNKKIAVLTDKKNNINFLANILLNYLDKDTKVILGQMIGTKNEKILDLKLKDLLNIEPSELDTLLIFNEEPYNFFSGIDENNYYHEAGLITKSEIRAITISFLELKKDSILWDIGTGSGSVSIEASSFCYEGKVYAIEKNEKRIDLIKKNISKFKCHNIEIVKGKAPEVLENLEVADRVFIGGCNDIVSLLDYLVQTIQGIIVANFVTIEKLNQFIQFCSSKNLNFKISSSQIGNLKEIGKNHYFTAQNMVYICKILNNLKI